MPMHTGAARSIARMLLAIALLVCGAVSAAAADFVVTKTADTNDGTCDADCSLREAIVAANASAGADRIVLGTMLTYTLSLGPADAPGALVAGSGDLDITDDLVIDGNLSIVDGASLDRVFDIDGTIAVAINYVTIRNGVASGFLSWGGGIAIRNADVTLIGSVVMDNSTAIETGARDNGGGISVMGTFDAGSGSVTLATLSLIGSFVMSNTGLNGGGIACVLCSLSATNGSVIGNSAEADGGGIDFLGDSSTMAIVSSTLTGNAALRGGGLSVPFGVSAPSITRSRIVGNTATTIGKAVFSNTSFVHADNNWWGCNYGPGVGGVGCGAAPNGFAGSGSVTPFLVMTV